MTIPADAKVLDKEKGLIYSLYDIDMRQLSQEAAGYNPIGMTNERACANCNWFVPSDNACVLVAGDIMPTGLSNLWLEKFVYTPDPIPVTIVKEDEEKSFVDKVVGIVKDFLAFEKEKVTAQVIEQVKEDTAKGFVTFRDKEDNLRFFGWGSNNFKDKHKEIIPEFAHKEFVEWCDSNKSYPELWLWHTPGTKYGQIDWLDVDKGFLAISGTIDKDKEHIAEAQANMNVGMSHGMKALVLKDGTIIAYRSYEFSTLPMEATAAQYGSTGFELLSEGVDMAFSEKKKNFLKQFGFSDEQVTGFETKTAEMQTNLKNLGYEWKEDDDITSELPSGVVSISVKDELAPILNTQAQLIEAVGVMAKAIKELAVADEAKIEAVFTAKMASAMQQQGTFVPTAAKTNIEGTPKEKSADVGWFGDVMKNIAEVPTA